MFRVGRIVLFCLLFYHLKIYIVCFRSAAVWNNATAKIFDNLEHELADDEYLSDVICFTKHVVTLTCAGTLTFWNLNQLPGVILEQFLMPSIQNMVSH